MTDDLTPPHWGAPAKAPIMGAVEAVALRNELRVIVAPYLRVGALALGADCVIAEAVISVITREVADARPLIAAEWRPIETAPRDGSEIVARDGKTGTAHVTCWDCGKWHDPDCHYYSEAPDFVPTEWTPLPAPPTAIKETAR